MSTNGFGVDQVVLDLHTNRVECVNCGNTIGSKSADETCVWLEGSGLVGRFGEGDLKVLNI